jgi:DNA-binding XRE family transcriptional regulator
VLFVDYSPWTVNPGANMLRRMKRTLVSIQRDLALNLREARQASEITQEDLALDAEVDRTYVSQIERGVGNPSIGVLVRLANCLAIDVLELLRRR